MSVEIIAEVGCNHLGNMDLALSHIAEAAKCGANTVKFQAYVTEQINDKSLHKFLNKAWLSSKQHKKLKAECFSLGVRYLCSAFDVTSAQMLKDIGCDRVKIPSGLMHDMEYMEYIRENFSKPYVSTGMATKEEVSRVMTFLSEKTGFWAVPFHCTTAYPCFASDVNIMVWPMLNIDCCVNWGFSDHTRLFLPAQLATARGASCIEHHFQIGDTITPDTPVSFQPVQFKAYVSHIRMAEMILGSSEKKILDCEKPMIHRRKDKKS